MNGIIFPYSLLQHERFYEILTEDFYPLGWYSPKNIALLSSLFTTTQETNILLFCTALIYAEI